MKKMIAGDTKKIRNLINEFQNFNPTLQKDKIGLERNDEGKSKQEDAVFEALNGYLEFFNEWEQYELHVNEVLQKIKIQDDQYENKMNKKPESNDPNQAEMRPQRPISM